MKYSAHAKTQSSQKNDTLCRFLSRELPVLAGLCVRQNRKLVLAIDQGLSLSRKGLTHGPGSVFERAVFQMLIKPGKY